MRLRRRRGFTLVEVMVYSVLLGLMMTSLYQLLSMTTAFVGDSMTTGALQASAQKTAVRITADLSVAHKGSVVTGTTPPGVVFLSPRDGYGKITCDASGVIYWHQWVCYYLDTSTGTLMRKQIYITATTTPPAATYTPVDFVPVVGGVKLADNVTNLTFSVSGAVVSMTASFAAALHPQPGQTHDYTLQVQNQAILRN